MRRTILSPDTINVLVASPLRYTGARLLVSRVYFNLGSSSASSSPLSLSSSSSICAAVVLILCGRGRSASSRCVVPLGSSVDSAAMLSTSMHELPFCGKQTAFSQKLKAFGVSELWTADCNVKPMMSLRQALGTG